MTILLLSSRARARETVARSREVEWHLFRRRRVARILGQIVLEVLGPSKLLHRTRRPALHGFVAL